MSDSTQLAAFLTTATIVTLSDSPSDQYSAFVGDRSSNRSVTTMPPSAAVDFYTLYAELGPRGLYYTAQFKLEPWVESWAKLLQPWQLTHRSRVAAISVPRLQVNELDKRLAQASEFEHLIQTRYALSDREGADISALVIDELDAHMKWNPDHIQGYIKEHEQSGMGGKHRWIDAYSIDRSTWRTHFDIMKENLQKMKRAPSSWQTRSLSPGIRARGNSYDSSLIRAITTAPYVGARSVGAEDEMHLHSYDPPDLTVSGLIDRSRMVRFGPNLSQYTVHIQQKASWYSRTLRGVIDILGAKPEFIFPYEVGGQMYVKASELHHSGLLFEAVDGKGWDTNVFQILGPQFNCWAEFFKSPTAARGYAVLGSGISLTSMLGTIANIVVNRDGDGTFIVLGDDMNHWYKQGQRSAKTPFAEMDPGDTIHKYTLGIAYDPDPDIPRLTGFKTTMDRAGKMSPVSAWLTNEDQFESFVKTADILIEKAKSEKVGISDTGYAYKRSREMRSTWAGAYFGQFGSATLLQLLAKVPASEYVAPGEMIEEMILEGAEGDPFAWAEEAGVRKMFTS